MIGGGACGLPASIVAREAGASVILVEAQPHVGGHARVQRRQHAARRRHQRAEDATASRIRPTSCSRISPTGRWCSPTASRTIATTIAKSFAPSPTTAPRPSNSCSRTVLCIVDKPPDRQGGSSVGNSVLRTMHVAPMDWPLIQTGAPANGNARTTMSSGNGLTQPLEAAARKAGVEFLLEHKMTGSIARRRIPAAFSVSPPTTTAPRSTSARARR